MLRKKSVGAYIDRHSVQGNCGNMASGVAPFAIEAGLVNLKKPSGEVSVKIRNTNTGVIMRSTLEVRDGIPLEAGSCILVSRVQICAQK